MGKQADVPSYKAKRGGKIVTIRGHKRKTKYFRNIVSSCVNSVKQDDEGNKFITIRGVDYPYPYLPDSKISGVVNASSAGKFYNKHIRGKFF